MRVPRCSDVYFTTVLLRLIWYDLVFGVPWSVEGVIVGSVGGSGVWVRSPHFCPLGHIYQGILCRAMQIG